MDAVECRSKVRKVQKQTTKIHLSLNRNTSTAKVKNLCLLLFLWNKLCYQLYFHQGRDFFVFVEERDVRLIFFFPLFLWLLLCCITFQEMLELPNDSMIITVQFIPRVAFFLGFFFSNKLEEAFKKRFNYSDLCWFNFKFYTII